MILKFRAQNIDKKRMIYLSERMDNDIHMQINNRSWGIFEGSSSPAIANKHYGDVLMQYTGLYDKDKSELYDKDIVKAYSDEFESSPMIGVINWDKAGQWIFDFGDGVISSVDIFCEYSQYGSVFCGIKIEKIGNIFENENLLTKRLKERYLSE